MTATAENVYASGGTRSEDHSKPDYEAMLSPLAMEFYAEYMFHCSFLADGTRREEDNWQKGVPLARWMKSLFRHVFHLHKLHRKKTGLSTEVLMAQAFSNAAVIFNAFGYLDAFLKENTWLMEELRQRNQEKIKPKERSFGGGGGLVGGNYEYGGGSGGGSNGSANKS